MQPFTVFCVFLMVLTGNAVADNWPQWGGGGGGERHLSERGSADSVESEATRNGGLPLR